MEYYYGFFFKKSRGNLGEIFTVHLEYYYGKLLWNITIEYYYGKLLWNITMDFFLRNLGEIFTVHLVPGKRYKCYKCYLLILVNTR